MAADTDRCIRDVGLEEAADQLASSLSGGQKRRLSLAIALVGDPPVLLLDEPTSGCDAAVRRKIWDLLTAKRAAGRTIVLSSHDMAECEVLADRVCILARGRLRVAGSTRFLKKEFGVGYHLTVSASAEASSARVLDVVREHVPLATLETDKHDATTTDERQAAAAGAAAGGSRGGATVRSATKEIAVTLPLSAVSRFPALFDAMDAAGADIGVLGYGLETTSLEEAFMRLVNALDVEADADEAARAEAAGAGLAGEGSGSARPRAASTTELAAVGRARAGLTDEAVVSVEGTGVRLPAEAAGAAAAPGAGESAALLKAAKPTGAKLGDISIASRMEPATLRQVKAVMVRRFQQVRRDYRALWLQCVLPVAFCAISIAFSSLSELNTTVEPKVVPFSTASWQAGMPEGSPVSALTVPFWVDTQDVDAYGSGSGPNSTQLADLLRSTFTATGSDRGIAGLSGGKARPVDATGLLSADPTSDAAAAYLIGPPGEPSLGFQAAAIVGSPATSFRPGWTMDMLFNTSFGNAPCAVFQLATNALLAAESGPLDGAFDPLPRSVTGFTPSDNTGMIGSYLSGTLSAFYVAMGFAVLPGIQAIAVVKERETRVRAVQAIMGLSSQAYWAGTWLWDGLGMGLVPGFAAIAVLGIAGLVQAVNLPAVAVLFILFSLSTPGPAYVLSFAFESAASAQTWIVIITTVTTVVSFFGSFVLSFPGLLPLDSPVPNAISIAFQVFLPPFCLAKGLADVATRATCPSVFNPVPPDGGPCVVPNAFDWDIAGSKLLFMAVSIPGWALVIAVIEYFQDPARGEPPTGPDAYKDPLNAVGAPRDASGRLLVEEDDDVVGERARVESHGLGSAPLVASSLRKVYFGHARPRVAVSRVDLAVPDGEIFGLLGPNGAGKTTLQKMLVGDLRPSAGKAAIDGRAVGAARGTGGGKGGIGYCPQFDALLDLLTVREHLFLFARIKGVAEADIPDLVTTKMEEMGLTMYADRVSQALSGGNRRKLSMAIALVSEPPVVFADEPSTGMDPKARRDMWKIILRIARSKATSVVLTSHSMEEVEALCSRVAIMVGGRLRCLGSIQHLKNKFGRGWMIEVRQKATTAEQVEAMAERVRKFGVVTRVGGEAADASECVVRDNFVSMFNRLGRPEWIEEVHPKRSGWMVQSAIDSRPGRDVPLELLAPWLAEQEHADDLIDFVTKTAFKPDDVEAPRLIERHGLKFRFRIPPQTMSLGSMFRAMEEGREPHLMADYSIGQTSLEQVFNQFAAQQDEEKGHMAGMITDEGPAATTKRGAASSTAGPDGRRKVESPLTAAAGSSKPRS
uniref:ABC transporter domain-containing protein n=1 Tax=Cafeteria roenbergensis TaxID=33653 RepID=A0A7S0PFT8_CAFRO